MNGFIFFVAIASIITFAVEGIKKAYDELCLRISWLQKFKEVNVSIFISIVFGIYAIWTYDTGLLNNLGIEYPSIWFKYFDLIASGLVVSQGSALVYKWLKSVKENSDSTTTTTTTK